jgi:branched-chain amino acid transport system ATP-binding protein
MLSVEGLRAAYASSQVLFDVSLTVAEGEFVSLMGRNGMGKTTTIRAIMGMITEKQGQIAYRGRDIANWPSYRIARHGLGLVPEGRQIFPTLTVSENLLATARPGKNGSNWTLERIYALFPILRERAKQLGVGLSGGEQQMLAIGRALMTNPSLLILDEATEGLAPKIRTQIWQSLTSIKRAGQSILVVDKNVSTLIALADRHYVIERGRMAWSGTTAQFRDNAEIVQQHLGI